MFKRIFMLLIALLLFGALECQGASDSKSKKSTSKAARQKSRRAKKNQKNMVYFYIVML